MDDFLSEYQKSLYLYICVGINYLRLFMNNQIVKLQTINYSSNFQLFCLKLITIYSTFVEYSKPKITYLNNNYPQIKYVFDYVNYMGSYMNRVLYNRRIEPFTTNWINTSMLVKYDESQYLLDEIILIDSYQYIMDDIIQLHTSDSNNIDIDIFDKYIIEVFNDIYESSKLVTSEQKCIIETMVSMRRGDQYLNRIILKTNDDKSIKPLEINIEFPLITSSVNFLTVEYTHPLMKNSIFLNLNKHVFYINNEILSAVFIKSVLEHQLLPYHFDMDYVVNIMDDHIKTFTLTKNKYILLENKSYKIMSNE